MTSLPVRKPIRTLGMLVAFVWFASCVVIEHPYTALAPGVWRAQLILEQSIPADAMEKEAVVQDIEEVALPVLFEVRYTDDQRMQLIWKNGDEEIISDSILYGRDPATGKDTLRIEFPVFDTHIRAWYEERVIEGYWEVHYKDNYRIPFVAFYGEGQRFRSLGKAPSADLTGKWDVTFKPGQPSAYPAIGEFKQEGGILYGTFLTETGDYRFLEGNVEGDAFHLSCFDGAHAYLFEGKIIGTDSLAGTFRSGKHYTALFTGRMNPEAKLTDAMKINRPTSEGPAYISGLDASGQVMTTSGPGFSGKPKVIQVMGTWCPNCRDESRFLKEYISDHPGVTDKIGFLAIAFEGYTDTLKNLASIQRYQKNMELPYPIWLGGNKDKGEASKVMSVLDTVRSYPTLIFLDKEDRVRDIHTGFSGPATSEFESFRTMFSALVDSLIKE